MSRVMKVVMSRVMKVVAFGMLVVMLPVLLSVKVSSDNDPTC